MKRIIFPLLLTIALQNTFGLHFVSYGDTRSYPAQHQLAVNAISLVNPELIIFSGDMWDGYTTDQWLQIINSKPNIAALLTANKFLVARGNHETEAATIAVKPSVVRNNSVLYSYSQGDCFFVCVSMNPGAATTYLDQQLQSAAAKAATWRIVFSHYPMYNDGNHVGAGSNQAAVKALCDKYDVALFLSGHDHNYQRTHQMYADKIVNQTNVLTAGKGTVYMISGGGGAPLYSRTTTSSFMHSFLKDYNFLDINTESTGSTAKLTVKARLLNQTVIDSFTVTRSSTALNETFNSAAGTLGFSAYPVPSAQMAIFNFPTTQGSNSRVEIRTLEGALVFSETLVPGQRTTAWNYAKQAQGDYMAVLYQDGVTASATLQISR